MTTTEAQDDIGRPGHPGWTPASAEALEAALAKLGGMNGSLGPDGSGEDAERRLWLFLALRRTAEVQMYDAMTILHDQHGRSWADIGRIIGSPRHGAWQWWQRRHRHWAGRLQAEREKGCPTC